MSTALQTRTAEMEMEIGKQTVVSSDGALAFLMDTETFNHLWRVAGMYSRSALVTDVYKGKPDDCFVIIQLALRLKCDPFMLMQSVYVVHGKPGMEAKMAIALCNARGPFSDRIQWRTEGTGMDRQCTAFAHDRATGKLSECTVTMRQAEAEGWLSKPGSKWRTIPELMLMYRSASWLIRTTCPEVLMGLPTVDELHDTIDVKSSEVRDAGSEILAALPNPAQQNGQQKQPQTKEDAIIDAVPKQEAKAEATIDQAEAESVQGWIDTVDAAATKKDFEYLQSMPLPEHWSDASRLRVNEAIKRRAKYFSRGERSNGG